MKRDRKILVLTTLLCLLPMLVGALVYDRLPESMVTHWNLNGEPDGRSGRALAVFGLPGLLAGVNILMHFALNADPKRANMSPVLKRIGYWSLPVVHPRAGSAADARLGAGLMQLPRRAIALLHGRDVHRHRQLPAQDQAELHHGHPHPLDAQQRGKLEPHAPARGLSLGARRGFISSS